MAFHAGTFVTDRLRLERPSRRDPSGATWHARDTASGEELSVRVLLPGRVVDDPLALRRFEREAELGARFSSPRIVRVIASGRGTDGTPFIAMEHVPGERLSDRLERGGRLSPEAVSRVVAEIGQALAEVHAAGMVHRDVASHNVWLEARASGLYAKLDGFALARATAEQGPGDGAATGKLEGSPGYLSPERVLQRPLGVACDVWALGAVAYEALTGSLPFGSAPPARVFAAVLQGRFAPPTARVPSLPAAVDAFFARVFSLAPSERFATPLELADAFAAAVAPPRREARAHEGAVEAAEHPTPKAPTRERAEPDRRRRRHELAAAVAIGVALGLLGVVLYRHYAERPAAPDRRLEPQVPSD